MGNSQSSDDAKSPSESTSSTPQQLHRRERPRDSPQARLAGNNSARKAQSHAQTTPPQPPVTALNPSCSPASTSTSNTHAQANLSASPAPSHSRARSITTGATKVRGEDSTSRSPMGNAESRHRPPSRSSTLPPPPTEKATPSPSSRPVDVPHPPNHDGLDDLTQPINSPLYGLPASDFSRPPRLPLPIERDPEPTSPIVTPQDATTPMEQLDEDELVPRRSSMLSSTTLDDDEVADIETFALESDPFAQKVLTTLQYRGEARSVFVTGTFARWEKKFRMQKSKDQNGETVFTLTAYLPAGTHHIRFLVDGEMIVTNQYLQTVDFTNSLVNYIEIAAKTPPAEETQPTAILPSEPVPIPGAETVVVDHGVSKPIDIRSSEQAPETSDKLSSTLEEVVPVAEKQDQHSQPIPIRGPESRQPQQSLPEQQSAPEPKPKKFLPRAKYTNEIPDILLHLDLYGEPHNPDYIRASKAIEHLPQPPSLPMFMTKSILNATTPHKDDASVLTMPNHTVINHLATSSIKSGVLATSSTTRYKKKFLTTIMYKPTSDDG